MAKIFDIHFAKSYVKTSVGNLSGSTNTSVRRFSTLDDNVGTAITYADSVTLGASFTINETGIYDISYTDQTNSTSAAIAISRNDVNFSSLTILASQQNGASESITNCAAPGVKLNAGDVIRPIWTGSITNPTSYSRFIIAKVRDA